MVDDALGGTVTAVVAVETPRAELGVAGQIQLQRSSVEVVEVDVVAPHGCGAGRVVPTGIAAEFEELLGVGTIHVGGAAGGLEEAHTHWLRSVVQGCEDVGLIEAFDVDVGGHVWHFLHIFGRVASSLEVCVLGFHTR